MRAAHDAWKEKEAAVSKAYEELEEKYPKSMRVFMADADEDIEAKLREQLTSGDLKPCKNDIHNMRMKCKAAYEKEWRKIEKEKYAIEKQLQVLNDEKHELYSAYVEARHNLKSLEITAHASYRAGRTVNS